MADRREKALAKAGSRGTKSPKILEIFITWHFEKTKTKWQPKLCSKLYRRTRKRYARSSDGFVERLHIIFAGSLEAGRLVKESGALRYVKLVARRLASLVLLVYYRTSKVYYLATRWLDSSLVAFNVYRMSKVYYLAARWLDGSLVTVNYY